MLSFYSPSKTRKIISFMHSLRGEWKFNLSLSYKITYKIIANYYNITICLYTHSTWSMHTTQTITYNIYIYNKKYLKEKKNIELTGLRNTLEGQSISKSIKNWWSCSILCKCQFQSTKQFTILCLWSSISSFFGHTNPRISLLKVRDRHDHQCIAKSLDLIQEKPALMTWMEREFNYQLCYRPTLCLKWKKKVCITSTQFPISIQSQSVTIWMAGKTKESWSAQLLF